MKRIINGKRYDTDTATHIAKYESDHGVGDFHYYREDLYLKKTGEFFLWGEGGGLSPYAAAYPGGGWQYGEKIVPLTLDEAKSWVEKIEDPDLYEELFEIPDEEGGNVAFSMLLPTNLYNVLDHRSLKDGITKKDIVVKALENYLKD